jgi:hypothetical protein
MSRYSIDGSILTDIADAIRLKKTGSAEASFTDTAYVIAAAVSPTGEDVIYKIPVLWNKTAITIEAVEFLQSNGVTLYYGGSNVTITSATPLPQTYIHEGSGDFYFKSPMRTEANITFTMVPVDINNEPLDVMFKPEEMATQINNMVALNEDKLILTGDCSYKFYNNGWNWFINDFSDKITTQEISNAIQMFRNNTGLTNVPFDINMKNQGSCDSMFQSATNLITAPVIKFNGSPGALGNIFNGCSYIRSFPEDYAEDWNWTGLDNMTSNYSGYQDSMFQNCYSLLNVPRAFISHCNPKLSQYDSVYYYAFQNCYNLEEVVDLVAANSTWSSNAFNNTFAKCNRLRDVTFKLQADGTPFVCNGWKNQVIDLTTVGYGIDCKKYNSDITDDTKITNRTHWVKAKKGERPGYWTDSVDWSVYNRASAVRTINTLPDVSGSGGTNTIKFNANGARLTNIDGNPDSSEGISSLSDAEIAVAAAKGWTVTLV